MDLQDTVFIVTGGKRIGRVVSRELAARGAHLVLAYRGSKEEAEQRAAPHAPRDVRPWQAPGRAAAGRSSSFRVTFRPARGYTPACADRP